MSGNKINIYNLCYNAVVLNKKPVKFALFGPLKEFFKNFLFYQNIINFDQIMNDFLSCVIFY